MFDFNDFFYAMGWFMMGALVRPFADRLAEWIVSKISKGGSDDV